MRTFVQNPKATQQTTSAKATKPGRAHFGQSREVSSILHLQRTIGNQAVQPLLQANAEELEAGSAIPASTRFAHDFSQRPLHPKARSKIQPKLTVSTPGDMYEQEADRVADQVMHMPEPHQQHACACGGGCLKCRKEQSGQQQLQTKPVQDHHAGEATVSPIVCEVASSGQPLDSTTRRFMESRFGHDFSMVRVHTDARAAESARAVSAQAYTVGRDVVFGAGQYVPGTSGGQRLMAHELTHVVQQAHQTTSRPTDLRVGGVGDVNENEAEVVAHQLLNVSTPPHHTPIVLRKSPQPIIMRSPIFTSTMEICHNYLKSREFHVSQGGLVVTARGDWEAPEWRGTEPPECGPDSYALDLRQVGLILDSSYGSCEFPMGRPFTRIWSNLPEDDYYLGINVYDHNPICCLQGGIEVSQQSGLTGETCTKPPPGPLEILHTALDLAGLIPALGAVPDAINAGIYVIEGDWTNAGLSAVAIIPIFGEAATVGKIGTRTVVRVTGERVERIGRDRILTGLREARASRRAATETAEGATEHGLRRRVFAQRNPPIADPTLPPGTGHTDRFGNVTYSSAGSATDQALVRYHEQVHSVLSPRLNFGRNIRADLMEFAYERSAFLRYLEEALAESYAQLRVHGIRNLPNGLRFPIQNGYVTLKAVVTEAAIGSVLFGGLTYGVYVWVSQESAAETP